MLHEDTRLESAGEAIDACIHHAYATWRKMHYPSVSTELAFTDEVYKIVTEVNHFQAGKVTVRVVVMARKVWKRESFFYTWQIGPHKTLALQSMA